MTQTAVEIAASVRTGALTARAATEAALARIEKADDAIGAFRDVRVFAALREADELDARDDRADLPLAGVPIAVKDNVPIAGEPMRVGSAGSDPTPQLRDHEIVTRLRGAGAVIVGVTNVPELCVFGATDSTFGISHNPWDLTRTPGGSSGGSAAAVAAGMVPLAHGNDGMGSIRIPSACCGLVGIKPGLGVVPAGLGDRSWFDMAENGPIATTVADCALLLSVLAGHDELATPLVPSSLRVAVSTKVPMLATPLDPHWAAAARETGVLLGSAGHRVRNTDPPYGLGLLASELARWFAGTERDARLLRDRSELRTPVRRQAAVGRMMLRLGLPRPKGRERWQRAAEAFFDEVDVLVTPTLAQPPIAAKAWSERGWLANIWSNSHYAPFAAPWNLAGWPAMAVPAGVAPGGMPLSVQLVARPGGEALLLGVAAQLEQLRPWERLAPAYR